MNTSTKTFTVADTAANADYLTNTSEPLGETMTLNVGPSHPATHGVLRLVLELDGEEIISCDPVVGHLHRGMEKIGETIQYNQFVPYTDRFDYLAPLSNNIAYACAVEKLMGWELPPRGPGPARARPGAFPFFLPHSGSGRVRHGRRRHDRVPVLL